MPRYNPLIEEKLLLSNDRLTLLSTEKTLIFIKTFKFESDVNRKSNSQNWWEVFQKKNVTDKKKNGHMKTF